MALTVDQRDILKYMIKLSFAADADQSASGIIGVFNALQEEIVYDLLRTRILLKIDSRIAVVQKRLIDLGDEKNIIPPR